MENFLFLDIQDIIMSPSKPDERLLEKDMYDFIYTNLRKRYPHYEGWEIYAEDNWDTYRPDFVVERRNRRGEIERVVVEAKCDFRVKREHIDQLNRYCRNLAGPNTYIVDKILAIPSGIDTSIVPNDVSLMIVRSVYFDGNCLCLDKWSFYRARVGMNFFNLHARVFLLL